MFITLHISGTHVSTSWQVLSIKNADFTWSKEAVQPVLEDINLNVKKGELVGVFGRVGCGKV